MAHDTLYAIGEALIDMIPAETGCDFGAVSSFAPRVGGAPANVAAAFARLGGRSALLTQLGDDPFGAKITAELAGAGVDVSHIATTDRANTALAFVSLQADGNRTFSFYRKPSADLLTARSRWTRRSSPPPLPCIFAVCRWWKARCGRPTRLPLPPPARLGRWSASIPTCASRSGPTARPCTAPCGSSCPRRMF